MNVLETDPKDELDSRISTKKSLFDVDTRTPIQSSKSSQVNKHALISGFNQTKKANQAQSVFNQDPEAIINKVLGLASAKKNLMNMTANDSFSVDSRLSPPRTNDYLFKKSSASRFFEPLHPGIKKGTGFSVPYGGDDQDEQKQMHLKQVQEAQLRQIEERKAYIESETQNNLKFEQDIVRKDIEKMLLEKDMRRARKLNQACTLRETLTKQAEAKMERKRIEQSEAAVFKYQFPFIEELQQPFLISPKKYHDEDEFAKSLGP